MNKMTGVSIIRLLLMLIVVQSSINVNGQDMFQNDVSFEKLCKGYNGKYVGALSQMGDGATCAITFQIATSDQKQAEKLCRDWIPHGIGAVTRSNKEVTCVAKVEGTCESDWTNIHGRCYKLAERGKLLTKSEAELECKKLVGSLYQLSRSDVPEMISIYFELSTIWLSNDEISDRLITQNPLKKAEKGSAFAMVFNSAPINHARFMSVIQIDPNRRAMALCTKNAKLSGGSLDPDKNPFKVPLFRVESGIYFLTTTLHGRQANVKDYDVICRNFFKPFLNEESNKQSFWPEDGRAKAILDSGKATHFIRIGGQRPITASRKQGACHKTFLAYDQWYRRLALQGDFDVRTGYTVATLGIKGWENVFIPRESCDSQYSSAVAFYQPRPRIYEMSDAYRAPLLCEVATDTSVGIDDISYCNKNWHIKFMNGKKYCYYLFEFPRIRKRADYICKLHVSVVQPYYNENDLKEMVKLMAGYKFERAWIGATGCTAVTRNGIASEHPCYEQLPMFCGYEMRQ